MSWHFLQEQEEASWEANSLDGAPSALLSLMPTASESCSPDSGTDSFRDSRSGTMCRPSTASPGADASLSLAADFHARTSAPPARAQALKASEAGCGERWRESLAKLDPATHSWKTAQCSLFGEGYESLATLPPWGIAANGELWELAMSAHLIEENESGFLPDGINFFHTPNTTGLDGGSNSRKALKKRQEKFPTPTASDYKDQPTSKSWKEKGAVNYKLSNPEIRRMWGTPKAQDSRHALTDRGKSNLGEQVAGLHNGGKLNPNWVEWLMGWPIGWTDLKPLEMDKCHSVQHTHGSCFQEWLDINTKALETCFQYDTRRKETKE